jgi:hypothetical protein
VISGRGRSVREGRGMCAHCVSTIGIGINLIFS